MTPTSTTTIQLDEIALVAKPVTALEVCDVIHEQRRKWLENLEGRYALADTKQLFERLGLEREAVGGMYETIYSEIDKLFNA